MSKIAQERVYDALQQGHKEENPSVSCANIKPIWEHMPGSKAFEDSGLFHCKRVISSAAQE